MPKPKQDKKKKWYQKERESIKHSVPTTDGFVYCRVCKLNLDNKYTYRAHLATPEHSSRRNEFFNDQRTQVLSLWQHMKKGPTLRTANTSQALLPVNYWCEWCETDIVNDDKFDG
jgi:hypothetical protein